MLQISDKLRRVWGPFSKGQKIGIECESSCDPGITAYVPWYDSNVHLCPFWWQFMGNRRASILLHELSHELAGTDDYFYYAVQTQATQLFPTSILADNADTYEGLYLKYFLY
jgi:hypothetical protein